MKLEETMAQREKNQAREKCNESAYVYSENVVYLAAQILERRGFEVWELPHANEVMLGSMSVLLRAEHGPNPYALLLLGCRWDPGRNGVLGASESLGYHRKARGRRCVCPI